MRLLLNTKEVIKFYSLELYILVRKKFSHFKGRYSGVNYNFTAPYQGTFYMVFCVVKKKTVFVCFSFFKNQMIPLTLNVKYD